MISDLFSKKIKCAMCGKRVKDHNLAWALINCADGVIHTKICGSCEGKLERAVTPNDKPI